MARPGSNRQLVITRYLQEMRCEMNRMQGIDWRGTQEERERAFLRLVHEYGWIIGCADSSLHQVFLYLQYVQELAALFGIEDPGPPTRYLPPKVRAQVIERDGHVCQYCRGSGDDHIGPDGKPWQIDHTLPLSRGGTDDPDNLALACTPCNGKKGTMTAGEFAIARSGDRQTSVAHGMPEQEKASALE